MSEAFCSWRSASARAKAVDVESIDGISQLRHLSLHDYGEEDEPDFSMGQKQRLHDAVMKTAPELLARLGGRAAHEAKDELRLRRD